MLYYDEIDVSEGINVHSTNKSKGYGFLHHWYFWDWAFKV